MLQYPSTIQYFKNAAHQTFREGAKIFYDAAKVFLDPNSNSQDVVTTGEKAFVRMYWGKAEDSLDLLQLVMYNQKLMKNKNLAV